MPAKADPKAKAAPKPAAKAEAKAKAAPKADAKAKQGPKADSKQQVVADENKPQRKTAQQPNRSEYDEKIKVLEGEIEEYQNKIQKISKQIDLKSTGKEEFVLKRDEAKANQEIAANKVNALEAEKAELQEKLKAKTASSKSAKEDVRNMQKDIGFRSEAEIDEKINDLEYKMHTETLTLKKEKEIMNEIAKLKAAKPKLTKMNRMASAVNIDDAIIPIRARIEDINAELVTAREEKKRVGDILRKIVEERRKAFDGVPELFNERKALNAEVKKRYEAIKAIRDERSAKLKEYYAQKDEQRKIYEEQYQMQKDLREAEKEKYRIQDELNRADEMPFTAEIDIIENSIKYCKNLQPSTGAKNDEATGKVIEAVEGTKVLLSKTKREEEYFCAPKKRAPQAKAAAAKKDGDSAAGESKVLKHDLGTLMHFQKFNVPVPATVKDLPSAISALEAKLEKFKNDQQAAIADRKAKRADREKALEEAAEKARIAAERSEAAQKRVAKQTAEVEAQ